MPRILRTVVPRIKRSIEERGLLVSLCRSVLLPIHLLREYRESLRLRPTQETSSFDREHGVDTDGELDGWVYLSDLEISSPNWIHGTNYTPIEPERFRMILSCLALRFEDFVFVDFGSGKGRALLLASEFPFKRIVGIEFSPELHAGAQRNVAKYNSAPRRCAAVESVCMDFLEFSLPLEASVLFLFSPSDAYVLAKLLVKAAESLHAQPRLLYLVYVAPDAAKEHLLDSTGCLTKLVRNADQHFCVYRAK
jgi:SAM-dependent methyltransferase